MNVWNYSQDGIFLDNTLKKGINALNEVNNVIFFGIILDRLFIDKSRDCNFCSSLILSGIFLVK